MIARKSGATTAKRRTKKRSLSKKKAHSAAKEAKRAYAKKAAKRPASWRKGGKEWSRVLGHFGITLPSSPNS